MSTYNKINSTTNFKGERKRHILASSVLVVLVLAVTATVTVVSLTGPRRKGPNGPGEEVSTAIVFGSPVREYTSILKNCSLTELQYNSTLKWWESHKRVTVAAPLGTPVLATFAGTVTSIQSHTKFGQQVTIEHRDGLKTVYSNLDNKNLQVAEGQRVEKGQQIGVVGQTANNEFTATPHLQIEVYKNNKRIDPNDYIDFPIK
ncbi:MAG: M23 family metallopeptidase [Christensenellaceae bacterium]|jgi:murein DD-endopeptidase MepM/ murein hydrolase activator NlpD|nr:M23 family metallopeptidase [Christensenellaceae bacterium]